jgi:hypothetical protein
MYEHTPDLFTHLLSGVMLVLPNNVGSVLMVTVSRIL